GSELSIRDSAYTFGTSEYKYLDELLELLKPLNIGTVYADNNFAYESRVTDKTLINRKNNTQKTERNHLTLRTRIKRPALKTICFSKNKIFIKPLQELSLIFFLWA
ncbi:MAG: IS1 family transposase, partial [Ruminococcus sp.]|nr:IS1 family transposase [Ruminococcus sp.]